VATPIKTKTQPSAPGADARRRRIGEVVHDDRGNASVKWRDAPSDYERPVLEILDECSHLSRPQGGFDPYARPSGRPGASAAVPSKPARTDLRKLSEHIKLMRALEARKRGGGSSGD
jgi:hypothetical protein